MIKEIYSKTILSTNRSPSSWFGAVYTMNIYRGCEHRCIYCDSRSKCYGIENFNDILVKVNAIDLLKAELAKKHKKGTIGTGAMSDPYTPIEKEYKLTQQALKVIAENNTPVHITTKSNIVIRDIDLLQEINKIYASVAFTITTTDDLLASKIEPFAPSSTERFEAMGILSMLGICTGITLMPILPFIEDNEENIVDIVKKAQEYGAKFIHTTFGMSMREGQREYYYDRLDEKFPGLRQKYEKRFGYRYKCNVNNVRKLKEKFLEACYKYGISTQMPSYASKVNSIKLNLLSNNDQIKI